MPFPAKASLGFEFFTGTGRCRGLRSRPVYGASHALWAMHVAMGAVGFWLLARGSLLLVFGYWPLTVGS